MDVYDKDPKDENPLRPGDSVDKDGRVRHTDKKDSYSSEGVDAAERGEKRLSKKEAFDRAAEIEASQLGVGGFYREEQQSAAQIRGEGKSKKSRKNLLLGGAALGLLAAGSFAVLQFLSGPLALIHFAQLLQQFHFSNNEDFLNGRSARYLRNVVRGQAQNNRLGAVGNKYVNRWETRLLEKSGLRSVYHPTTGRFIGYEVVNEDLAGDSLREMGRDGIDTNGQDTNGRRIVNLEREGYDTRRSVIRTAVRGTNTNKVSSAIASRLLKIRAGVDFHPFKGVSRRAVDRVTGQVRPYREWADEQKEERSTRRKEGVDPDLNAGRTSASSEDTNNDGTNDTERPGTREASDSTEGFRAEASADGNNTPRGRSRLSSLLRGGAYVTAITGLLCVIDGVGEDIPNYQFDNLVQPAKRIGGEIMTAGNQLMLGVVPDNDLNSDEVGSLAEDLDTKAPGSFLSARSVQFELGKDLTGSDIDPEAKPGRVGEKPALFDMTDSMGSVLDGACNIQNFISSIPIIREIGEASSLLADAGLGIFGTNQEEIYSAIVNFFAGEAVDTFAQDEDLGNISNYGMLMASGDFAQGIGGRKLEPEEVEALDRLSSANRKDDNQLKSYASRIFNIKDVNSMVASMSISMPRDPRSFVSFAFSGPLSSIKNLMPKAKAAGGVQTYDYGIDEYGFSVAEQNNPRYADPFENADRVEPRLAELNERYSACFSMSIDPTTYRATSGKSVNTYLLEEGEGDYENCDSDAEELKDYRMYLADKITELSLVCYEGETDACSQLGMSE